MFTVIFGELKLKEAEMKNNVIERMWNMIQGKPDYPASG